MDHEKVIVKESIIEVKDGHLDLSNMMIRDIQDIQNLDIIINLKSLNLSWNQIKEIKGLESLINLENLYLSNNQIKESTGLETLHNLKVLFLDGNQIPVINKLETLINLERLVLNGNKITEITGLKTLNQLMRLDLKGNQITEIKGLETLINLEKLTLDENPLPSPLLDEIKSLPNRTFAKKCVNYCIQNKHYDVFEKPFRELNHSDLEKLIEIKYEENERMEYKQEYDLSSPSDKKEFLKDITGMANNEGGFIIYGIKELDSFPTKIVGLQLDNTDEEHRKIESIIRSNIAPQDFYYDISFIPVLDSGKKVMVIKIDRKKKYPYRETTKAKSGFYLRKKKSVDPMTYEEIRDQFVQKEQ